MKEYCSCSMCELKAAEDNQKKDTMHRWIGIFIMALIILTILFVAFAPAEEFTDTQIVNAIYMAEGGPHATYPFGIRSVYCSGYMECRKVCERTVKHYRREYQERCIDQRHESFISYLQRHYCPTNGHLSRSEERLNKNWIKNINFFLHKGKSHDTYNRRNVIRTNERVTNRFHILPRTTYKPFIFTAFGMEIKLS